MSVMWDLLTRLKGAVYPEDVFGLPDKGQKDIKKWVSHQYHILVKASHPDSHAAEYDAAEDVLKELNRLFAQAEERIASGVYGNKNAHVKKEMAQWPVTFRTRAYTYALSSRIHSGGTSGVFQGIVQDRKNIASSVIVKVPHTADDNDLMKREADALGLMQKKIKEINGQQNSEEAGKMFSLRVPRLLESAQLEEEGSPKRKVMNSFVQPLHLERGWFTLEHIRKAYPDGVGTRIMTFIWNRVLEGLTLAHASGILHCALTPNHIIVHARQHMGNIVDWTASCRMGSQDTVPYMDDRYAAYVPDEMNQKIPAPSPGSDIYMSAWCMVYLLGGSPEEGIVPDSVETPIRQLLNRCLQPKRGLRPQNMEVLAREFRQVALEVFGPPRFVEFTMPDA